MAKCMFNTIKHLNIFLIFSPSFNEHLLNAHYYMRIMCCVNAMNKAYLLIFCLNHQNYSLNCLADIIVPTVKKT